MAERMSKRVFDKCKTLTRQVCVEMLTGIGFPSTFAYMSSYAMQQAVYAAVIEGELHPRDILGEDY